MDARTAESPVNLQREGWLQRERASGRFYDRIATVLGLFLAAMVGLSIWLLRRSAEPGTLASPPLIALLLVAILLPAITLMALYARKVAVRRAERGGLGSGRLHVRLVALFTAIAAVPTVLVAIFASLLFQSGLEFWFSDRSRTMLENTVQVAQVSYQREVEHVAAETLAASDNLADYLQQVSYDDPRFGEAFAKYQVLNRQLSEAIIFTYKPDKQVRTLALVNPYNRDLEKVITSEKMEELKTRNIVSVNSSDRIGDITRINWGPYTYLYMSRVFDPLFADEVNKANDVMHDYRALLAHSRVNQLKFNGALLLGALLIVALAILTALRIADRLVRPVGELVNAAGRVEEGDFSARVPVSKTEDEVQTLATAFNRMTGRLEEQTNELRSANTQLETRRAFIEAVLSSVTAGVIAVDSKHRILLLNRSAETLLEKGEAIEGQPLGSVSPELEEFMRGQQSEATVLMASAGIQRTLAVKRVRYQDG
ncbi:MAG TPA: HAMP domain-containing protein, partial [Sphingomicrobium sp.]|nr:HAMP domain-containing protein [Sphingomicrobium sp.]